MKRSPIKRRTPLRKVGAKALREQQALRDFRFAVRVMAGGRCQAHTPDCPPGAHDGHHAHHRCIADRRLGRHDPARGLLVCEQAHRYIHAHPAESYERGWLLHWDGVL